MYQKKLRKKSVKFQMRKLGKALEENKLTVTIKRL